MRVDLIRSFLPVRVTIPDVQHRLVYPEADPIEQRDLPPVLPRKVGLMIEAHRHHQISSLQDLSCQLSLLVPCWIDSPFDQARPNKRLHLLRIGRNPG